jgi:hypothetical protein
MLNPSDVYVEGGANNLYACWTDKVTKYDASSFYNFEQDNLPLHDLEERTTLLWEKFGHPTSAITGMSFIVSAEAESTCNPLYFNSLSSCIDALPEFINYPILVEVASFGGLGHLTISNKSFGPDGSLEIVNRLSAFGSPITIGGSTSALDTARYDTAYTGYNLASSIGSDYIYDSILTASAQLPVAFNDVAYAKLLTKDPITGADIPVASSTYPFSDERFVNPYVFVKHNEPLDSANGFFGNRMTAALSSTLSPFKIVGAANTASAVQFNPFDKTRTTEMDTYDVSTVDPLTELEVKGGMARDEKGHVPFVYFNSLYSIKVHNCDGPIYIRNFNVDCEHAHDNGIEIQNSKVNLERCAVSRANRAGLYASNSEVDLLRGFVAYRNYKLDGTVREGIPFVEKRNNYKTQAYYGAGIYASQSTINFRSTYNRDIEQDSSASSQPYYSDWAAFVNSSGIPVPSMNALYCLSRNDIGIHSINSTITGGLGEKALAGDTANTNLLGTNTWYNASQLFCELNTEAGIKIKDSELDYRGRLITNGNYMGLESKNSDIVVDQLTCNFNQSTGLNLEDSKIIYNNGLWPGFYHNNAINPNSLHMSQVACVRNGQAIRSSNSEMGPLYTSSMPSVYQMVYVSGNFGVGETGYSESDDLKKTLLPAIEACNNSNLDLIHTHVDLTHLDTTTSFNPTYGAMLRASDNSTITCRGSKNYANVLLGPGSRVSQIKQAAAFAGDNSQIFFQGPTVIAQVGVDALAEKNSTIDFGPARDQDNHLMVSAFELSGNPDNHTMVELHSTRACLVANEKSVIKMQDLGDYNIQYDASRDVSGRSGNYDYILPTTYLESVSNGWIQLYPNGNVNDSDVPNAVTLAATDSADRYKFRADSGSPQTLYRYLVARSTLAAAASGVTTGGMSVRAVGDSLIDVQNVHFPCGWANSSSVAYDFDGASPLPGAFCSRLHVWNVADTSLLKASYVSVSGVHPVQAPYHGPSGTWGPLSGAPATTPDTSSLSILDYYGVNEQCPGDVNLGKSSIQNVGPFRLYFSVDPAANFLSAVGVDNNNAWKGIIPQLFAQGYSFSGDLIAEDNSDYGASANYTSLLKRGTNNIYEASGYYYPSEMISNPDTILAVLDDSAANMFANAKHNSVDKSLLGKRVEIFYPMDTFGGDINQSGLAGGKGLLSINNFDLKKDN